MRGRKNSVGFVSKFKNFLNYLGGKIFFPTGDEPDFRSPRHVFWRVSFFFPSGGGAPSLIWVYITVDCKSGDQLTRSLPWYQLSVSVLLMILFFIKILLLLLCALVLSPHGSFFRHFELSNFHLKVSVLGRVIIFIFNFYFTVLYKSNWFIFICFYSIRTDWFIGRLHFIYDF